MSSQLPQIAETRIGLRDGEFKAAQGLSDARDLGVRNVTAAVAYGIQVGQLAICDVLNGTAFVLGPRTEGQNHDA